MEVLEGEEGFGGESTASDWEDSGLLDSDDEEIELVRELVFVDEVEVRAPLREPLREPEPEPELPEPLLQVAIAVERPLRRSGRKKK